MKTYSKLIGSAQPATANRVPNGRLMEPGRYLIPKGVSTPVTLASTVPGGRTGGDAGVSKHVDQSGRELGWGVTTVDSIFTDPCGPNYRVDRVRALRPWAAERSA